VRDAGLPGRGAPDAIVVVRDADGKLRDLSWIPDADVDAVPVAADTDEGRSVIRHSAAHVLAQAVRICSRQPNRIGPPITDGFYYDFDVADPFHPKTWTSWKADAPDRQRGAAVRPARLRVEGSSRASWPASPNNSSSSTTSRRSRRHGGRPATS